MGSFRDQRSSLVVLGRHQVCTRIQGGGYSNASPWVKIGNPNAPPASEEGQTISNVANAQTLGLESFEHINLNDVDDSRKALPENVYTLEVNKLDLVYRKVSNPSSEYAGQELPVLKGSYTVTDDPEYSGRKLWQDFWVVYKVPQIFLKKQMQATGVIQADGESLGDYAAQFASLNPPARFQVQVKQIDDRRNPEGPKVNEIAFFTARPC